MLLHQIIEGVKSRDRDADILYGDYGAIQFAMRVGEQEEGWARSFKMMTIVRRDLLE